MHVFDNPMTAYFNNYVNLNIWLIIDSSKYQGATFEIGLQFSSSPNFYGKGKKI